MAKVQDIQQKILDSYELDFAKYAPSKEYPRMSIIWYAIPNQLAKENGKFISSHAKKGIRAKDLEDSLEWLINAGLVYKVVKIELFKEFKGALTENYVLCELVNLQNSIPYYWKSENTAEVDFVAQFGENIVPIEVKSERGNKARNFTMYRKKYAPKISMKTSLDNVSGANVKCIPLYMLCNLGKIIPVDL